MDMKKKEQELDMYQAALKLEYPWFVTHKTFDDKESRLDVYINFDRNGRFTCAYCGTKDQPFHDVGIKDRVWRHLDFWQYKSYLHAPLPRVKCSTCNKVKSADVS